MGGWVTPTQTPHTNQEGWGYPLAFKTNTNNLKIKIMKMNYKEWDYTLILVGLVLLVAVLTSCTTTGYGCNGRSKCMTRVR